MGGLIAACGLLPGSQFPLLVLCTGLSGACCAGFAGPATTLLQKNCEPEYLGRVMGIFNSATALGMPAGTAIGGAVAAFTGVKMFFVADGVFMLIIGVAALLSASLRSLDGEAKHDGGVQVAAAAAQS